MSPSAPQSQSTLLKRERIESQFFHSQEPLLLHRGGELPEFTLAWQSWGKLNAAKDNAILVFHALSGSHHLAGLNQHMSAAHDPGLESRWSEEMHEGWWEAHVGPGKPLDTDRYFILSANYLGGCYGSTGPSSINPSTGKLWAGDFPHISARDVVESQLRLLDSLGIDQLHAVIGPSVGGLLAFTLATAWPERTRLVAPLFAGLRTTVLNRLILLEQIIAIENDPHFYGGFYYDKAQGPQLGLTLARMISHKTFVHLDAIERRSRKEITQPEDQFAWYQVNNQVESYMLHQGKKFVSRFDANTYLRVLELWSTYNPLIEAASDQQLPLSQDALYARSREAGHRYLVFSIDSDFCFYPEEQAALVEQLEKHEIENMHITVHSQKGHDSFLLEPRLYAPHLDHFLRSI